MTVNFEAGNSVDPAIETDSGSFTITLKNPCVDPNFVTIDEPSTGLD